MVLTKSGIARGWQVEAMPEARIMGDAVSSILLELIELPLLIDALPLGVDSGWKGDCSPTRFPPDNQR